MRKSEAGPEKKSKKLKIHDFVSGAQSPGFTKKIMTSGHRTLDFLFQNFWFFHKIYKITQNQNVLMISKFNLNDLNILKKSLRNLIKKSSCNSADCHICIVLNRSCGFLFENVPSVISQFFKRFLEDFLKIFS